MKMITTLLIFTLFTISPAWSQSIFKIETSVGTEKYEGIVYRPENGIKAVMLISATIGGVDALEERNADYFSKHGYLVIIICPFKTEIYNPHPQTAKLDEDYFRPVTAATSLVEAVDKKLKLKPTLPLFAIGASQGGIYTIVQASHFPRIRGSWIAVAGGDLPHIYSQSMIKPIADFRANHMRELKLDSTLMYEFYLQRNLKNDPLKSCQNLKSNVMQVIALRDDIVPTESQERLASECPPHDVMRMNLNHGSGTLTLYLLRAKIKDYFDALI